MRAPPSLFYSSHSFVHSLLFLFSPPFRSPGHSNSLPLKNFYRKLKMEIFTPTPFAPVLFFRGVLWSDKMFLFLGGRKLGPPACLRPVTDRGPSFDEILLLMLATCFSFFGASFQGSPSVDRGIFARGRDGCCKKTPFFPLCARRDESPLGLLFRPSSRNLSKVVFPLFCGEKSCVSFWPSIPIFLLACASGCQVCMVPIFFRVAPKYTVFFFDPLFFSRTVKARAVCAFPGRKGSPPFVLGNQPPSPCSFGRQTPPCPPGLSISRSTQDRFSCPVLYPDRPHKVCVFFPL